MLCLEGGWYTGSDAMKCDEMHETRGYEKREQHAPSHAPYLALQSHRLVRYIPRRTQFVHCMRPESSSPILILPPLPPPPVHH